MNELTRIAAMNTLHTAWRKVRTNGGAAGLDGESLERFEQKLEANLARLSREIGSETYRPRKVRRVFVPKHSGDWRELGILTVRDRVVQRAATDVLAPMWEATFLPCSHGFRVGRSRQTAIAHVERLRDCGLHWAVDGDIRECFDSLNHKRLMREVRKTLADSPTLRLIERWLTAGVTRDRTAGALQGGSLSPLLCNIYLHAWDDAITRAGYEPVRYADDWLILCRSQALTEKALSCARVELERIDLAIHPQKTRMSNFDDGVTFVGAFMLRERTFWLAPDTSAGYLSVKGNGAARPSHQMQSYQQRGAKSEKPPGNSRTPIASALRSRLRKLLKA